MYIYTYTQILRADCCIGCDGIHSYTRKRIISPPFQLRCERPMYVERDLQKRPTKETYIPRMRSVSLSSPIRYDTSVKRDLYVRKELYKRDIHTSQDICVALFATQTWYICQKRPVCTKKRPEKETYMYEKKPTKETCKSEKNVYRPLCHSGTTHLSHVLMMCISSITTLVYMVSFEGLFCKRDL